MSFFSTGPRFASKLSLPVIAMLASFGVTGAEHAQSKPKARPNLQASRTITDHALPLVFEENAGQAGPETVFAGRAQRYTVELQPRLMRFNLLGKDANSTVTVSFTGAHAGRAEGVIDAGFRSNYYIGSDPKLWHEGVRNYDRVALRALYPGIDAEFYSHEGQIEHDFIVAPGADASRVRMHLAGTAKVVLTKDGNLDLQGMEGYLRLHKPNAYQLMADGTHQAIDAGFELVMNGEQADLSFALGTYDHSRKLVIDPVITYATYVTGNQNDTPAGIVSDAAGNTYITGGTYSSMGSFGAVNTPTPAPPAPPAAATYIAQLAVGANGSRIAWVTIYGSATLPVLPSTIAITPSAATLFVGGQTTATDIPTGGTTFDATPASPAGTQYGYVASFVAATGVFNTATYVEATKLSVTQGTNLVQALSATNSAVYIAGATNGASLVQSATPLNSLGQTAVDIDATSIKGIILELDPTLTTEAYGTYLNGTQTGKTTILTGIAADGSGNIYVSGYTSGNFPESGVDNATLITPPALLPAGPPAFWTPSHAGTFNGFAAEITPATATIDYSYFTNGGLNDVVNGLALDSSNNLFLFGNTASPGISSASSQNVPAAGTQTSPFGPNPSPGVVQAGFVARLDSTGFVDTVAFVGGDTGSTSSALGGAVDAAGNVYITGSTNAVKANFPLGAPPATPLNLLPTAQDVSNNTNGKARGYLLQATNALGALNYLAYFGSTAGTSTGVGVAVDAATLPNAYVLISDTTSGTPAFTLSSADQASPVGGTSSAYVAQVSFAAPAATPALSAVAASQTYTVAGSSVTPPLPVTYVSPTVYSTLTLKFQVVGGTSGAKNVVFDFPYNPAFQPYSSLPAVTFIGDTGSSVCTLGPTPNSGFTCVVPSLTANTIAEFDVTVAVGPGAVIGSNIAVTPTAYDAQGDAVSAPLTLSIPTAGVPVFTVSTSVNPGTANAALSNPDSVTPNTLVTYTYSVTNTSANASPLTSLTTNLSSIQYPFTASGPATLSPNLAGCDITTTQCSVPAGATVTYSVSGVFLASDFAAAGAGPYTFTSPAPTVSFASPVIPSPTTTGTGIPVTIRGNASLSVSISPSSSSGNYRLGDPGIKLNVTVANAGANAAGAGTVAVTLPKGFIVSAPVGCVGSPQPATCTLSFTGVPANGNVVIPITGTFSDTGTTADAVAPPLTSAGVPTPALVASSASSGSVTASAPAAAITLTASGTYAAPSAAATPATFTVVRANTLGYTIAAGTPLPSATVNETNPTNALDPNSLVSYTVTVQNTGVSVARGLLFTIPIPVPANATLGARAVVYTTAGNAADTPSAANQISCAPYVAGATSITCYTNDLNTTPATATTTPAAQAYTITFTATYNELTVPLTTASGTVSITQLAGSVASASLNNTGGAAGGVSPGAITVERQTKLTQTLTVTRVGAAPATFIDTTDINLDEHIAANAAGKNDTLTFSLSTSNAGPNDAAGLNFNVPLPAYANILNFPATCTIGGTAGGPSTLFYTGTTGATMTCAPPSSTTPAGTAAGQLASGSCAGTTSSNTSFDGKCFIATFSLKFVDAASNATVVGALAKAPVSFSAATASGNNVNTGATFTSSAPATLTVQRAAHLRLSAPVAVPIYTDGVTATNGVVAQAAFRANPTTLALTSGKVYNCFRYKVSVINDGPNYTNSPSLNYAIDLKNFVSTQTVVGTATNQNPLNCAGANPSGTDLAGATTQTKSLGPIAYGGGTAVVSIDGYFDVGAIGAANSSTATFQTQPFTADYSDSNNSTTTPNLDYKSSPAPVVTVGNTPFNDATTQGFIVVPLGSAVPVDLVFNQVDHAGVTGSSSSSVKPTMPSGTSPYPPDKGATRTLYQPGVHPTFYTVSSTATSAVASNPTTVCVVPGAALADTFIKPERVLLWVLGGTPFGTTYNTVPNIANTVANGSLAGDITFSVLSSGSSYVTKPATITFPQTPQAQPSQVCGKVNGVPVAAGTTLGVLEPVNFAPFVIGGTATVAVQTGKGATTANSDAFVNVSSTQTHDFNDHDPCYVGGARASCDDNDYLFVMTFGGGHTGAAPELSVPAYIKTLAPETSPTTTSNAFFVSTGFNLGATDQIYIAVMDQSTGADSYNTDIVPNPYAHQGDFLQQPFSAKTGGIPPVCDPGTTTAYYTVSSPGCPAASILITGTQNVVLAGSGYLVSTVGSAGVTGTISSGSGLVGLPYPDASTPPTTPAVGGAPFNPGGSQSVPLGVSAADPTKTTAAIAFVTPGQTAGFQWGWLAGQAVLGLANGPKFGDIYTLGCEGVDLATQQTVITPPAGISCTITTSTPTVAGSTASPQSFTFQDTTTVPYVGSAPPTIFVITSGNQFAQTLPLIWQRAAGGIVLALMVPVFFFRRKIGRGGILLMALLTLAVAPMLSGCGTTSSVSSGTVAPTGSYLFRVTATSSIPGRAVITSAPFEVVVQKAN